MNLVMVAMEVRLPTATNVPRIIWMKMETAFLSAVKIIINLDHNAWLVPVCVSVATAQRLRIVRSVSLDTISR